MFWMQFQPLAVRAEVIVLTLYAFVTNTANYATALIAFDGKMLLETLLLIHI
jgi:hypothetical protein